MSAPRRSDAVATVRRWLRPLRPLLAAAANPRTALAQRRHAIEQRKRIGSHPLFAQCSRAELRTLLRWGEELEVPAGVTLVRERAVAAHLVAVLDGSLRRTVGRGAGTRLAAGDWVGAYEVLSFAPERSTVVTDTACRVFILGARSVLSYAVHLRGLRAVLFPSLDEHAATLRVRELRAEGLAEWRRLRLADRTVPSGPAPAWLQRRKAPMGAAEPSLSQLLAPFGARPVSAPAVVVPPLRLGRAAAIATAVVIVASGAVGATVHLPYHALRGEIVSASEAVEVEGRDPDAGRIYFPIVDARQVTALEALAAWHDGAADVRSTDELLGGRRAADVDHTNQQLMASSTRNAVAAVARLLPASGVDAAAVTIDPHGVGGPSGGLAFALALVDGRTPGDLTAGRLVAATGEVDADGAVFAVGGTRLKAIAARRAGCAVLIVPRANLAEALPEAGSMEVVAVESLAETVQKLVAAGGRIG